MSRNLGIVMITSHPRPCRIRRVSDLLLLHRLLRILTRYSHRHPRTFHHCWMACESTCCQRSLEINGWYPSCQLSQSLRYAWTPYWAFALPHASPRCTHAGPFHSDSLVNWPKEEGGSTCACVWHICCRYLLYEGAHTPSESRPCHSEEMQVLQIWPNDTRHQPQEVQGFRRSGI